MITTIIILSILNLCLGYAMYNILKKYETLEDENEFVNEYINRLQEDLKNTVNGMKEIDTKGSFESDDETGTIFSQLKNMITDIETNYLLEGDSQSGKEEEEKV